MYLIKFFEERQILHECGTIILLKWIKRVVDHRGSRILIRLKLHIKFLKTGLDQTESN